MTAAIRSNRPGEDEYPPFMSRYVGRVPDGNIVDILTSQRRELMNFLRAIPDSKGDYRYAPEKWTIREVTGHVTDAERIFTYRALRFSRADTTPVEGFDENTYVTNAPFARVSFADLIDELEHVRGSTIHLFANLDDEAMQRHGVANGLGVSVRGLAYIVAGHAMHHIEILKTRYLAQQ